MTEKRECNRLQGYRSKEEEIPPTSIILEESMNEKNEKKQRRRLSAEEKWQIYRECEQPWAKVLKSSLVY